MLVLTRKTGQALHIGEDIHITITEISGDKVKIGIQAPRSVNIVRDEIMLVTSENAEAAKRVSGVAVRSLAAKLAAAKSEKNILTQQ